ncbi:MAG: hypothetical protein ACLUFF_04685 [Acutalibacteraceae bacterium]
MEKAAFQPHVAELSTSVQWKVARTINDKRLQKVCLSEQGAKDLVVAPCVLDLSFMFPVGLLYFLVADLMKAAYPAKKFFLHRGLWCALA